jgi:hypothetical protein
MDRYHIKTGFKESDKISLAQFTTTLNGLTYKWTMHSLDNLKYRAIDSGALLRYIKDTILKPEQIFEFYCFEFGARNIAKVCYRIPWNDSLDVILVLDGEKTIITVYLNSRTDEHITLKESLYIKINP